MLSNTATIRQSEIPGKPQSAVVRNYSLAAVAEMEVDFRSALLSDPGPPCAVGVSIELAPVGCYIQTLALATQDKVFCLLLQQSPSSAQSETLQKLFSNIEYLTGFELPYTIVLLAYILGFDVSGYDLSSLSMHAKRGALTTPGNFINSKNISALERPINERWDGGFERSYANFTGTREPSYALRAWFTAIAANMAFDDVRLGQRMSTQFVEKPMLQLYSDLTSRVIRLDCLKPRIQENDFCEIEKKSDGTMIVHNSRYKTRIRASRQTHLEVQLKNGDIIDARINGAEGRRSSAMPNQRLRGDVSHIRVIGREERTNAEQAQYRFLMFSLTMTRPTPLFVDLVWFPGNPQFLEGDEEIELSSGYESRVLEKLNDSQREVVSAMLSTAPQDSLVITHGPPGTGKTTTIAAAAEIWSSNGLPCWIIAQSNVGVKNIAESLLKREIDFKLIVSQEFLVEW
ncbi:hypothetical protein F5148DRAFT_608117 [Russula earlei]|uniref:Uncharacterized protein n=1 Tax=Russula earlei TaxID=71964 RepID=A0ACC0UFN8_9AGAM|nr:hypothetical protein F5148DRAFT_608117 [Russula earlei]